MIMKILHLYYDIMNLYGDYANVSALERILNKSGVETSVDRLSFADKADFTEYDFIFIGSGTEKNQKLVLEDFKKYSEQFKTYIESGKPVLMTGNSFEMLGKSITDCNGNVYNGLELFDFTVTEQNKTRVTGDIIYNAEFSDKPVVGFVNKCSEITGIKTALFSVVMGLSDNQNSKNEGIRYKNLFGTHVTGPLLMKNPYFLEYIAEIIKPDLNTEYLEYEKKGYNVTLNELKKRMENIS